MSGTDGQAMIRESRPRVSHLLRAATIPPSEDQTPNHLVPRDFWQKRALILAAQISATQTFLTGLTACGQHVPTIWRSRHVTKSAGPLSILFPETHLKEQSRREFDGHSNALPT